MFKMQYRNELHRIIHTPLAAFIMRNEIDCNISFVVSGVSNINQTTISRSIHVTDSHSYTSILKNMLLLLYFYLKQKNTC
jgi:hypothetical protein